MIDRGDVRGLWDYSKDTEPWPYSEDNIAYELGIGWLDEACDTIEDWGCGTAWAKYFVKSAAYKGIDGSDSRWTDVVADLRTYSSSPDGIFMRGVIEHNPDWAVVLANAVECFTRRMVLLVHTPFSEMTHNLPLPPSSKMPDISFRREDLLPLFGDMLIREQSLVTGTWYGREHAFFLVK